METRTPPTIDDLAVVLPALVRALGIIVEQMEPLVHLSCHATNLPEESADAMSDIGNALVEQSRLIMREANERRTTGPGRSSLRYRDEEGADGQPVVPG